MERDPLDPELAALFRAEAEPPPPSGARARVLGRLEGSLPAVDAKLGGRGAESLGHGSALGSKMIGVLVATFVAGGVVGGVAVAVLRPAPPARVVYVERPEVPMPPERPSDTPSPPAPVASAAAVPSSVSPAVPASSSLADDLAAERVFLEDARTRLAAGDAPGALTKLQDHARRYPHGKLAEEREALAIEALVQTGRYDAARARAAQFRGRWPTSVLLPAVDATLQSIP